MSFMAETYQSVPVALAVWLVGEIEYTERPVRSTDRNQTRNYGGEGGIQSTAVWHQTRLGDFRFAASL
jgi:hypothetical protein